MMHTFLPVISVVAFITGMALLVWLAVLVKRDHAAKQEFREQQGEQDATDWITAIQEPVPALEEGVRDVEVTAVIPPVKKPAAIAAPVVQAEPVTAVLPPAGQKPITMPVLTESTWATDGDVDAWITDMRRQMEEFDARLRSQLELV